MQINIGERIRQARKSKGLSQSGLGEAIGRQIQTISDWETGRTCPKFDDVCEVAEALGMPLTALIYGTEDANAG